MLGGVFSRVLMLTDAYLGQRLDENGIPRCVLKQNSSPQMEAPGAWLWVLHE